MGHVYVLMYFKCKICFTVYTGETKINDTIRYDTIRKIYEYICTSTVDTCTNVDTDKQPADLNLLCLRTGYTRV